MAPFSDVLDEAIPSVVVVDPRFDAYKPLAASARLGKITLHFRASGAEAVKLARRLHVDAWLIAPDLEDMSGHDLVPLLQAQVSSGGNSASKVAVIDAAAPGSRQWSIAKDDAAAAGADTLLTPPITFADLEELLGLPTEERSKIVPSAKGGAFVTLPVGVGAAVIAIAVLMMG